MTGPRRFWIGLLTAFADSLWLYPAIGVFGLVTNQGGAPVSWLIVAAILMIGGVATRYATRTYGSGPTTYMVLASLGLVTVYFTVADALGTGAGRPPDFSWFARVTSGNVTGPEVISIVVALLSAAYLWRRALRIADDPSPDDRLRATFRTGTLGLAVILVVEFATSADLKATEFVVPFFVVSLCGLALVHRPRDPAMARHWFKIVGATVSLIIATGFMVGLLGGQVGGTIIGTAGYLWSQFLAAAAYILDLILAPILELFFSFIESLRPEGGGVDRPTPPADINWEQLNVEAAAPFVEAAIAFLRFPLIALFLYFLIKYLIQAHRHWNVFERPSPVAVAHESIERSGDDVADIARLLQNLLPDWMLRRRSKGARTYPRGTPGISEVFELYYEMLDLAAERGDAGAPSVTPNERIEMLKEILPNMPVAALTGRFNAACFGAIPTDTRTIADLRNALDGVKAEAAGG